jgi:hypothetical protein
MEIVEQKKGNIITDRFEKFNRNMRWEDGEIIMKGVIREFPRTEEGRRRFFAMGGGSDWRPLDVPDTGEYQANNYYTMRVFFHL